MKKQYDYIIVGAGLFGLTFSRLATDSGMKCLILEKRDKIGGNCATEIRNGIEIHTYGPHIFHTNDIEVWQFVNKYTSFNNFLNCPIAINNGKAYNLPFNMNTFSKIWDITSPESAYHCILNDSKGYSSESASNLEEKAISMVGKTIYKLLVKDYTEKQWGKSCKELPPDIIKRLPLRFTYDNRYFEDKYQGIPENGYMKMFNCMLKDIEINFNTDYLADKDKWNSMANKIIYTGPIDEYFDYCLGTLGWRSLSWEIEEFDEVNHQGNAVVNYTDKEHPYTRMIEYKHFNNKTKDKPWTYVAKEFPEKWELGKNEPFYPVNTEENNTLYNRYKEMANKEENVIFGGRLGTYSYLNMDQVIGNAIKLWHEESMINYLNNKE